MGNFWSAVGSIGHSIGLLALLGLTYGAVHQVTLGRPLVRQLAIGVLFGCGAVIAMLDPLQLAPGLIADVRSVMVALSGPFGGPVSLLVSGGITGIYRLGVGGAGALPSLISIGAVILATLIFMRFVKVDPADLRLPQIALLGMATCPSLLGALFLPSDLASLFFANAAAATLLAIFVGVILLAYMLKHERSRLRAETTLRNWALTDALTGLPNRRAFETALARLAASTRRRHHRLAVLMIDLDRFKEINDRFGHSVGDDALAKVGQLLGANTRASDIAARYGGEEFIVAAMVDDPAEAVRHAERLRELIEASPAQALAGGRLTVSIGVSWSEGSAIDEGQLVAAADGALYKAKAAGRNRVRCAAPAGELHQLSERSNPADRQVSIVG